jgi:hypothetical protein
LFQILQRCAEFLKAQNHWVGVAGILLGAALSAYFYFASKPAGEISLKFKTVKIAHAIPDIKILDAENNPISSDVFAPEIVVWNSGDLPVGEKSDRLRRSIILVLDKGTRILAAQVQETANATLSELNTHLTVENESLRVEWQEFDPGDALKLSVIYSSKNQSNIDYRGRFIGTKMFILSDRKEVHPEQAGLLSSMSSNFAFDWENNKLRAIAGVLGPVAFVIAFILMPLGFRAKHTRYEMAAASILAAAVLMSFFANYWSTPSPPL